LVLFPGLRNLKDILLRAFHNTKLRFLFAGGSTAVIYFGLLYLLHDMMGQSSNLSVGTAYFVSTAYHFLCNKFFVHRDDSLDTAHLQLGKYLALIAVNYAITWVVTNGILVMGGNVYLGVCASVLITLVFTYVVMRRAIFRRGSEPREQ